MVMPENLQNEQSSCSFSRDTVEIINKPLIKSSYYKNTVTTDLKNKLEAKILDEATRVVNVFLIS